MNELVQMVVAPYKRGNIIGAGPGTLVLQAQDGHIYQVATNGVVELKRVEPLPLPKEEQ